MAHCLEGHAMEYSSMVSQGCEVQMQSICIFYVVAAALAGAAVQAATCCGRSIVMQSKLVHSGISINGFADSRSVSQSVSLLPLTAGSLEQRCQVD